MNVKPPTKLRCEYLTNPLGVDTIEPRFSWQLKHEEQNQHQTAYQILVSTDKNQLLHARGDIWDSGKVSSNQTTHIVYAGRQLQSARRYFWCSRWWDKNDNVSPCSEIAYFEMGLLNQSDWKAKWIRKQQSKTFKVKGSIILGKDMGEYFQAYACYLRKEFQVTEKVNHARAYVCGLGYYELRLNGQKIGNRVLDPAQTDYQQIALYSTYDITALVQEHNAVGVILGNGRHVTLYGYDHPKLILQIVIEYINGRSQVIFSDESWKVSHGPLTENSIYHGERYDARLEMTGWDQPHFNDSDWANASPTNGPILASQLIPPVRVTQKMKAEQIYSPIPDVYIFDFAQNFTGWAKLNVQGSNGTEVKLRYAELIHPDGTLNTTPNQRAAATDIYILRGEGLEIYEPRFTYHGFRYVEVTGFPGVPTSENLEGCFVHTDVEKTGNFSCSSPLINQIHQNVLWGLLSNLNSLPTDCPQRDERYGWLGDAHLAAEAAIFNFDMVTFYTKFLNDIQQAQHTNGSLPDIAPNYLGGEATHPADPAWGAAYIIIAWYLYWYYGDIRILEQHYGSMKRYIEFLSSQAENYILKNIGKYGDWCPPGSIVPKRTKLALTSTWYFYYEMVLISKIAGIIGNTNDADEYASLADKICQAFNREFIEKDQYAGHWISPVCRYVDQTSNALPLYLDMVPEDKKHQVLESLLHSIIRDHDYHLDTGIIGTRHLLDVLTENGHEEVAYKIVTQKSYPGWGYMIADGATTLWERWEKITGGGMNSHNHIMLGSVDAWFYQVIAGIRCLEPGWRKVRIKPGVMGDLKYANASLKTIRGELSVSWQKTEIKFELIIKIPVGVNAEIYIPRLWKNVNLYVNKEILLEKDCPKTPGNNLFLEKNEEHFFLLKCGSGYYKFYLTAH